MSFAVCCQDALGFVLGLLCLWCVCPWISGTIFIYDQGQGRGQGHLQLPKVAQKAGDGADTLTRLPVLQGPEPVPLPTTESLAAQAEAGPQVCPPLSVFSVRQT